jgi:hypothetical protein
LFDRALAARGDAHALRNFLHEAGHAHFDTLPAARQAELVEAWRREVESGRGPLYVRGRLRPGVAEGVEASVKEWYAERLAWANHAWARRRMAGDGGGGFVGRAAGQFRELLGKMRDYVARLTRQTVNVDFRTFLDQGDRYAEGRPGTVVGRQDSGAGSGGGVEFARRGRPPAESLMRDARAWLVRNFTSAGGLPPEVFRAKTAREGRLSAVVKHAEFAVRDLDRAVHEVFGGYGAMTSADLATLNDVLGGRAAVGAVDPRLQGPLGAMRADIDVLSRRLVSEGVIAGKLAARVEGNIGFYLHRSYRKFDDPKWAAKVPEAVYNRAASFIRAELAAKAAAAAGPGGTPAAVSEAEVQGYLQYMLGKGVKGAEAFFRASREGAKGLSIFTARKDIPEELRSLLGEYTDPRVNYLRSVAKTAQVLEAHAFLKQARAAGLGKWLFDRPLSDASGDYTVQISAEGSEAMAPLNGLYTTPEIAQAFAGQFATLSEGWKWWLRVNGWAKTAKTVLSPVTQARNLAGNLGFLVANGHWRLGAAGDVWRVITTDLGRGDTPANRDYVARLHRLGILGESVHAGELREALRDAGGRMQGGLQGLERWTEGRLARASKAPFRAAARLYQMNDEIFKVYAQ